MKKIIRKFLKVCSSTWLIALSASAFQISWDSSADTISRVLAIVFGLISLITNYFVWEVELKCLDSRF